MSSNDAAPQPRGAAPAGLPRWLKPVIWAACLTPFLGLVVGLALDKLGANPVETITEETGEFALRLLLATLAITPLRRLSGWQPLARLRRLLGLFAFFYVSVHFTTYAVLDASLDIGFVVEDIVKRPYISAGFVALVLLVPLAATSTRAMQRRLGGLLWRRLHRAAYVATAGAVLHLLWQAKIVTIEELVYALTLGVLLLLRVPSLSTALPRLGKRLRTPVARAAAAVGRNRSTARS